MEATDSLGGVDFAVDVKERTCLPWRERPAFFAAKRERIAFKSGDGLGEFVAGAVTCGATFAPNVPVRVSSKGRTPFGNVAVPIP